jgi:hypothetical protein
MYIANCRKEDFMKYIVSRTSDWNNKVQPCENAKIESYTYKEVRTFNSFVDFDEKLGKQEGKWLSKGINHCINERGYVQREFPKGKKAWFIKINSINALMEFVEKYGEVIIGKSDDNNEIPKIEIYDNRE